MVRIKDIADYVGVSTATVSNVIHGKNQRVSPAVREKILSAMDELGYVPNMSALMLAQTKSPLIGVVIPDNENDREVRLGDPYFGTMVGCLERSIRRRRYRMFPIVFLNEEDVVRQAQAWNLRGLIVCNLLQEQTLQIWNLYRKNMVTVDTCYDSRPPFRYVLTDDFNGGYLAGKYLIEKGHRRICMLASNDQDVDHSRWLGLCKACTEAGIELTEKDHLICPIPEMEDQMGLERFFPVLKRYTAVFVFSDYYALQLISFLQNRRVHVPEDLSVISFDDLIYARLTRPGLTTIRQNIAQKAELAVQTLLGEDAAAEGESERLVPVQLIERDSVISI